MFGPNWRPLYRCNTPIGPFVIAFNLSTRRYDVWFDGDVVDHYTSPADAAVEIGSGWGPSVGEVADTSELGIPEDISEWDKIG